MSDIVVTPELTKAIQDSLNPADMRTLVQAELAKQTDAAAVVAADQATADKAAADRLAADATAAETNGFARVEVIGGKEFTFEASNELELERMVNNAYKVAYALSPAEQTAAVVDPAVTAAAIQKEAEDKAVAQADLELKFKRGDISAADYIEQSGALDAYLTKNGVPLSALKKSIEAQNEVADVQSWSDATEVFQNGPGADWPGGQKNLEILGLIISSKPELLNATDKVAALVQAYESMKSAGTIFPYEAPAASTLEKEVPVAAAVAAPAVAAAPAAPAAPAPRTAATSSSLFGMSSGSGEGVSTIAPKGDVKIDPNASPVEIIEAWKKAQVAGGKDPNAAFTETFSGRRV